MLKIPRADGHTTCGCFTLSIIHSANVWQSSSQSPPSGQAFARGRVQSAPFVVRVALDDTGLARTLPAGSAGEAAILPAMSKPRMPSEKSCFGRSGYDLCQSVLETPAAGPLRVRGDRLRARNDRSALQKSNELLRLR